VAHNTNPDVPAQAGDRGGLHHFRLPLLGGGGI